MPSNRSLIARPAKKKIADPETVLRAAKAAPKVFSVGAYFSALYVMRRKGHSWRFLSTWLRQFNIDISHVHLHRLYVKEDARLSALGEKELRELGVPREIIEQMMQGEDPTKRMVAPDPDDLAEDAASR